MLHFCVHLRVDDIAGMGNSLQICMISNQQSDAIRNQLYWRNDTGFAEM